MDSIDAAAEPEGDAIPREYKDARGRDAGEETMLPNKGHELYGGIYTKIRHPQCLGEMPLWWSISLFLNSPFLVCFSCLNIPA